MKRYRFKVQIGARRVLLETIPVLTWPQALQMLDTFWKLYPSAIAIELKEI